MAVRRLRLLLSPNVDWEAQRRFYRDVLGLTETGGWSEPGDHGAFLALPVSELEVMEQDATALGVAPEGGPWHVMLAVDDLDVELSRLRDLGVPVLRPPVLRPWGARDAVIADPAGNALLLFEEQA